MKKITTADHRYRDTRTAARTGARVMHHVWHTDMNDLAGRAEQAMQNLKENHEDRWAFGDSTSEVVDRALRYGELPPDMLDAMRAAREACEGVTRGFAAALGIGARRRVRRLTDGEPDVERCIAERAERTGTEALFERRRRVPSRQRVVTLGVPISMGSDQSVGALMRPCAIVAAACETLRAAGIAVRVLGVSPSTLTDLSKRGEVTFKTVEVSPADEPVDALRIAALGVPGVVRGSFFQGACRDAYEAHGHPYGRTHHAKDSLGCSTALSEEELDAIGIDAMAGIGIDGEKWLRGIALRLGVESTQYGGGAQ